MLNSRLFFSGLSILVPLLFCLNGCIPAAFLSQPAVSGRLINPSGKGIANAKVTVRYDHFDQPIAETQTDPDGKFRIPSDGEKGGIYFLMQDNPRPPMFVVEYNAQGKLLEVGTFTGNRVLPFGLGERDVRLPNSVISNP